jgi:MarR family transcriptional regulator, 2-MHQ and catechol-resistance regulon repressor
VGIRTAILEALLHKGPQSVRELGRRIDLTSGSMTAAIDRMETRHLVARADHATAPRAWVIHLTPAGKALITKCLPATKTRWRKR